MDIVSVAGDLWTTEITIAALIGHSAATVTGHYIHHVETWEAMFVRGGADELSNT